jgi:hypothetical protein
MTNDMRSRVERFVEVAVFAPVGIALTLRDMAPTFINMFVSRGRAEIDRHQHSAEKRLQTIKSTGEVALAFGVPVAKRKLAEQVTNLRGRGNVGTPPEVPAAGDADRGPTTSPISPTSPTEPIDLVPAASATNGVTPTAVAVATNGSGPSASELAIPGYDQLAASQVVERLVGLSTAELGTVRAYEAAHRNRRTILGKIDQLASA